MEAYQRILESLTPLNRVGNRRSSDEEPIAFDARQVLEFLQFANKGFLMSLSYTRLETKEY